MLVRHFVDKHCRRLGRPVLEISVGALDELKGHHWPGNVRELESVIERAVLSSPGPTLRLADLGDRTAPRESPSPEGHSGNKTLEQNERDHIVATLERTAWRIAGEGGAAALLAINPSTLRSRMQKLGIARPGGRPAGAPGLT